MLDQISSEVDKLSRCRSPVPVITFYNMVFGIHVMNQLILMYFLSSSSFSSLRKIESRQIRLLQS